jgi:hypothetical protein
MKSKIRKRITVRLAALVAAALPLALIAAAPAFAAAPTNDEITNATVISTMPFHDSVPDMTQATWNPTTDQSNCGGWTESVWYQITPTSTGPIAIDIAGSNNGAFVIDAFTGTPGSLVNVGCSQFGLMLNATAGTTYWIMASSACCITGGSLNLTVYPGVAPQATLAVHGTGLVDKGRNVTISGTINCTGFVVNPGAVTGTVRQVYRRIYSITANFSATNGCGGKQTWSALAQPTTGGFGKGYATVNASESICNLAGCATPTVTLVIKLK